MGFGHWRLAAILGIAAGGWALVAMGVVMPYFRGAASWRHLSHLGWTAAWDQKGIYLAVLMGGLGVFPFLGRRALAAALGVVPGVILNLSVDRTPQYGFEGHYDAQTVPFFMIAAGHGVGWITARKRSVGAMRRQLQSWAAFACSIILAVIMWDWSGSDTVIQKTKQWMPEPGVRAALAEARSTAQRYADAPSMTAHHRIGPHVSARPGYVVERAGRTRQQWVVFASGRLRPGHIFILSRSDALVRSGLEGQVRASGAAKLVEAGYHIEVWRWPSDAPDPGTREARTYAASHYRK